MKILKKILLLIWVLMMLLIALILLCAWKPEITDKIAGFLYSDMAPELSAAGTADTADTAGTVNTAGTADAANPEQSLEAPETSNGERTAEAVILETPSPEYDPPSQSELEIPESVSGKSGYQEIQEKQEEIGEETAQELSNQLGMGQTGDGATFDPLFYPYYAMLDERGQRLYRQIYANANAQIAVFAPVQEVQAGELRNIFAAVYNDHPELFWVETAYSCKYRKNGQCVEIALEFNRTVQDLSRAKSEFEANAQSLLALAQTLDSSYEKEKMIHDALLQKIEYRASAEMSQSAYSAMVNGQTVCAGYARAFQYLMQQLGIPCYYCTGYAGENHAWNIILLGDGYYNVDVTWDDTEGMNYDYFNRTDQDYAGTHMRRELSVYLPVCSGQQYRNLEQAGTAEENLRSMEELGFAKEAVHDALSDYYADCYGQMTAYGLGEYVFYSVVEGNSLMQELYQAYQTDGYRQGYMDQAMTAVGAAICQMRLEMEPLQNGRYLITHSVILTAG